MLRASPAPAATQLLDAARAQPPRRLDQDAVEPRIVVGGLEPDRHPGQRAPRSASSFLTPRTPPRGPVIPTSLMYAVPPGKHAGIGGRNVGVGADDRRHAAVEVPAEPDLLARRLGVHVDEDVVALLGHRADRGVGFRERRTRSVHEQVAGQRQDAEPAAIVDRDVPAVPGLAAAGSSRAAGSAAPGRGSCRPRGGGRHGYRA